MKRIGLYTLLFLLLNGVNGYGQNISLGDILPDFKLKTSDGKFWHLSEDFTQETLIVYFYPAAMTGGCTAQACAYRDNMKKFESQNTQVIAISGDNVENLAHFKNAHDLNFPLLSDSNGELATLLGVPTREGGVITRTINGEEVKLNRNITTSRWTFVLNKKRELIHKESNVNPSEDSNQMLNYITKLK